MWLISSASTRAALALASAGALLFPSIALAQQPVAPTAGEPPALEARAQEQAQITAQSQQVYAQTHQDELRREAARQVAEERRAAWDQRGRDNVPPAVITHPPALALSLPGRFGFQFGDGNELPLGITAELDLRMRKWWGLGASVGILGFRSLGEFSPPNSRLATVVTEGSGFVVLTKTQDRFYDASYGVFRLGHQILIPIAQPGLPSAYLGFFAGIGGKLAVGPINGGKGYVALDFEARVGFRFGLGSGADSPITGGFFDLLFGPVVGF